MRNKRARKWHFVAIIACVAVLIVAAFVVSRSILDTPTGVKESDTSTMMSAGTVATESFEDEKYLPTPYIATCKGVNLHCAVTANHLTEILIHNASYNYALALTTKLKEATNVDVMKKHGTGRVADEQPTGNHWMRGEFIRCYRADNAGPIMSAIDCGAAAKTTVYAPVSGKVLLVKKYKLYKKYPDYQIHIQPTGKKNLDVVLIHLQDTTVTAGDKVIGGQTPIAHIRDVYAYIGDAMQLKDYTAKGDNGNHTHIAVNDVTAKNYDGLDDLKKNKNKNKKS